MSTKTLFFSWLATCFILQGCQTLPSIQMQEPATTQPTPLPTLRETPTPQTQDETPSIDEVQLSREYRGRISVTVESKRKQKYFAAFHLYGVPEDAELVLTSTLGTTLAKIAWNAESAALTRGNATRTYANTQDLMLRLVGTDIALKDLWQWIEGKPWKAEGWNVQTDGNQGPNGFKATRIVAQRYQAELSLVTIILLIDD